MRYSWKFQENQFKKTSPTYVAYCRAFSLLDKIRELKAEKKTSPEGPETLLDLMEKLTEGCIRKVNKLDHKLLSLKEERQKTERKHIEKTIRAIVLSVNELHAFLRYVDATRLSRNPTGMIKPWELLIKKFYPNLNVIIRPQWKHNYSYYNIITILSSINDDIIGDKDTAQELDKIGLYFPVLSFAGLERDNVLLHIILAHEIGHLIDGINEFSCIKKQGYKIVEKIKTEVISDKLAEFYDISVKLLKTLQDAPAGGAYDLFIEHEAKSQAQEELAKKIVKWLEEITADIIGVRIIGPSFIFALYQTQLAQIPEMGPAGDYPPPQIRIENCIEYWESFGKLNKFFNSGGTEKTEKPSYREIRECFNEYLRNIKKYKTEALSTLSGIDKIKTQRYNLLNDILREIIKDPLDSIKQLVEDKLPAFELDNSIFEMIELLKNRISPVAAPSGERDTATFKCDIASILNAGWIFWLTHEMDVSEEMEKDKSGKGASLDKLRTLCYEPLVEISNLILKGIDLTDFNKQFADQKRKVKSE